MEFEVTLAHKRSDKLNLEDGVYIQPKLDGVRCYTRVVEGEVKMFSRNHKEFHNCKHIITQLQPLFDYAPELILDGELYNHSFKDNFNKIISLVRKSKPTQADKFESASHLQYHIYDMYDVNRPDLNYQDRLATIKHLFGYKYRLKSVKTVITHRVDNQDVINMIHKINKDEGYEGSMLRANEAYQQKRSHGLQKVKDWQDTEAIILDYVEGKGKFAGGLGKFIGIVEDREVELPWPNLTIKERQDIFNNIGDYIGKTVTFEYFERTPGGAYRFPRVKCIRNYE